MNYTSNIVQAVILTSRSCSGRYSTWFTTQCSEILYIIAHQLAYLYRPFRPSFPVFLWICLEEGNSSHDAANGTETNSGSGGMWAKVGARARWGAGLGGAGGSWASGSSRNSSSGGSSSGGSRSRSGRDSRNSLANDLIRDLNIESTAELFTDELANALVRRHIPSCRTLTVLANFFARSSSSLSAQESVRQHAISSRKVLLEQMHLGSWPQFPMPPWRNLSAHFCCMREKIVRKCLNKIDQ